jgi:phosphopantetheinyl transferase
MTMSITLALDAARRLTGREPVAVEHVRALRWLVIEPPVDVTLRARHDGAERVRVGLDGHFEAVVRVGDGHPEPPAPQLGPPAGARTAPISARDVYEQHWMFHGPAYHGIVGLDHYGDDGLSGTVEALAAPGALLDAAGQMTGVWISLAHAVDRMALPVRVERIELFGPLPPVGERLRCTVRMRSVGSQAVTADMELVHHERVWARIVGWQDWRFPTDERLWSVFTFPERNLACDAAAEGYVHLHAGPRLARLRDQLARRFLTGAERDEHEAAAPGRRAQWLNGRVAAKDAVRRVLFEHGADAVFPIEVGIRSEPSGRPVVEGCLGADVRVSIAHTGDHAFALAAVGRDPGIDAEPVEPRSDGFAAFACGPAELALLPEGDRDEWLTRFWCAKEALGKARGTGLAGRPRALAVTAVDGERVQVEGAWVDTRLRDGLVVAWIVR